MATMIIAGAIMLLIPRESFQSVASLLFLEDME